MRSPRCAANGAHNPLNDIRRTSSAGRGHKKSDNLRRGIVQRAELSEEFDILAAWEEVEKLDESIAKRSALLA
jgi:hypothetical protein